MKFKVATLNFWGTSWPLSFDKNLRYKNLVCLIKKNKIDVISFQELWSKRDFFKLKRDFPTYHFCYGKFGLAIMSKFPTKNCNCTSDVLCHSAFHVVNRRGKTVFKRDYSDAWVYFFNTVIGSIKEDVD